VINMLAAIRIRGRTGVKGDISDTLDMLRLTRINHAVIIPDTPSYQGMLLKAKDYITWGEIDQETLIKLINHRGMLPGRVPVTEDNVKEALNLSSDCTRPEKVTEAPKGLTLRKVAWDTGEKILTH
jgi:large subunit ribosomal protein L30